VYSSEGVAPYGAEVFWNAVNAPSQMNGGMATAGNPATQPSPETVTHATADIYRLIQGPSISLRARHSARASWLI
jgi:hypothetical protein